MHLGTSLAQDGRAPISLAMKEYGLDMNVVGDVDIQAGGKTAVVAVLD